MGKTRQTGDLTSDNNIFVDISNDRVGFGITTPTEKVHVSGNIRITGGIYDSNNSVGTAGSVLSSTGSGIEWIPAPTGGGGSGTFDTGITTSIYVSVTSGIGTAQSGLTTSQANNDIFIGPGIAYSFPSTAGKLPICFRCLFLTWKRAGNTSEFCSLRMYLQESQTWQEWEGFDFSAELANRQEHPVLLL